VLRPPVASRGAHPGRRRVAVAARPTIRVSSGRPHDPCDRYKLTNLYIIFIIGRCGAGQHRRFSRRRNWPKRHSTILASPAGGQPAGRVFGLGSSRAHGLKRLSAGVGERPIPKATYSFGMLLPARAKPLSCSAKPRYRRSASAVKVRSKSTFRRTSLHKQWWCLRSVERGSPWTAIPSQ
jgi:hypothetical protein